MTAQRDSKLRVRSYDEALEAAGREAKATLLVAVALMLFFGAALWLLKDSAVLWLGIPLWFWVGKSGGTPHKQNKYNGGKQVNKTNNQNPEHN